MLFQRGGRVEIYKNLVDEGGFKHVRVVPVDQIWPLPPKVLVKGFSFGDKVDAYDNDGWWFEKISEKIGRQIHCRFDSGSLATGAGSHFGSV
ncbi:hypothetical protein Tco_1249244 [Tanacetum coccineum]